MKTSRVKLSHIMVWLESCLENQLQKAQKAAEEAGYSQDHSIRQVLSKAQDC